MINFVLVMFTVLVVLALCSEAYAYLVARDMINEDFDNWGDK